MEQAEALSKYREYVKSNPSDKEGARRSFYDTFKVDPENTFSKPKGEVSRMAGERLKHLNPDAPEGPGMVERGLGKVVGTDTAAMLKEKIPEAAGMIGMALAGDPTAGKGAMFLAAAKRVLTGAAMAGGSKAVLSTSATEGAKEARDATIYGAFGEGVGVSVPALAKVGGKVWESVVLNAAKKSQDGVRLLGKIEGMGHEFLQEATQGKSDSVRGAYQKFITALNKIPVAEGEAGKITSGVGKNQISNYSDVVAADLRKVGAEGLPDLLNQPLDALITMHSRVNQMAYGAEKSVPAPVRRAAQDLADDLRGIITKNLSPEERKVFETTKDVTKETVKWSWGNRLGQMVAKRALGAVVGAGAGLAVGGPVGLGVGVAADLATEGLERKYGPVILQHLMENNKLAVQRAISTVIKDPASAEVKLQVFGNALARLLPKDFIKSIADTIQMPGGEARAEEAPANIREGQKFIEKMAPGSYGDQRTQEKLGMRRPSAKPTPTPVKAKDQKTIPPPGDPNEPLWLKAMRRQREINR